MNTPEAQIGEVVEVKGIPFEYRNIRPWTRHNTRNCDRKCDTCSICSGTCNTCSQYYIEEDIK